MTVSVLMIRRGGDHGVNGKMSPSSSGLKDDQ
jgi:hypothetical protein